MEANKINEAPVEAAETATGKSKMSKGQIIGMVVLTIVALAGVAFGVFGMMEKDKAEKNLAIKITDAAGKVTDIITDKITSVDEDGTVTEITDTNATTEKNPIIKSPSSEIYAVQYSEEFSMQDGKRGIILIHVDNGKISNCSYNFENCNISGLPDNIYTMETIQEGNGGVDKKVGFITTDGSVYYMPIENTDFVAKKANIDGEVKNIVGINYCPRETCYASTVFVMSDNSIVKYSEEMFK